MKLKEINNNCEESCVFVRFLSPSDKLLVMRAKQAALEGRDVPGLSDILCANCTKEKAMAASLEEKMKRVFAG